MATRERRRETDGPLTSMLPVTSAAGSSLSNVGKKLRRTDSALFACAAQQGKCRQFYPQTQAWVLATQTP